MVSEQFRVRSRIISGEQIPDEILVRSRTSAFTFLAVLLLPMMLECVGSVYRRELSERQWRLGCVRAGAGTRKEKLSRPPEASNTRRSPPSAPVSTADSAEKKARSASALIFLFVDGHVTVSCQPPCRNTGIRHSCVALSAGGGVPVL